MKDLAHTSPAVELPKNPILILIRVELYNLKKEKLFFSLNLI
jgi:hypothetical protein